MSKKFEQQIFWQKLHMQTADPDRTAPEGAVKEQSDQGLYCLPFH